MLSPQLLRGWNPVEICCFGSSALCCRNRRRERISGKGFGHNTHRRNDTIPLASIDCHCVATVLDSDTETLISTLYLPTVQGSQFCNCFQIRTFAIRRKGGARSISWKWEKQRHKWLPWGSEEGELFFPQCFLSLLPPSFGCIRRGNQISVRW